MNIEKRIEAFATLGERLESFVSTYKLKKRDYSNAIDEELAAVIESEHYKNAWFTEDNLLFALENLGKLLEKKPLIEWIAGYPIFSSEHLPKNIGIVMAGNIPLVGFNDFLCILISGNTFWGKLSSKDESMPKIIARMLIEIEPEFEKRILFTERQLTGFDAIIATGSNNASRYFDYYFGSYPHIIRGNRNSVAILTGNETPDQLCNLGHDIFSYFGLGCRNVSKLYLPGKYDFEVLFSAFSIWENLSIHNKYANNYDYQRSILLMNCDFHLDFGYLLMKESESASSPLAMVYFEYYEDVNKVINTLSDRKNEIQCIVSGLGLDGHTLFGNTQKPLLTDYADNIDTLSFLAGLNT